MRPNRNAAEIAISALARDEHLIITADPMNYDYFLRDVPERLWQPVKIKVEREGWKSIRWVIVELLRRWVAGEIDLREPQRVQKGGLKPKRR